jgi:hypothetical protein
VVPDPRAHTSLFSSVQSLHAPYKQSAACYVLLSRLLHSERSLHAPCTDACHLLLIENFSLRTTLHVEDRYFVNCYWHCSLAYVSVRFARARVCALQTAI